MITRRSLEMCSSRTLFGLQPCLAWPSVAQRPQVREVKNGKPCPTRGGGARPEVDRRPIRSRRGSLIARKPTDRQVTEEDKADYEKAVADYMKAKKGGPFPAMIVPTWHPLSGG